MSDADPDAGERPDLYRRHRFAVEVEGLPTVGFTEVRGLEVAVDGHPAGPAGPRRRGLRGRASRFPTRPSHDGRRETTSPNLELVRGVTDDLVLWRWMRDWVDGDVEGRTVGVYLLDEAGDAAVGWVCEDATPVAWSGPTLGADSPGVAVETLELEHDGLGATTDASLDASAIRETIGSLDAREFRPSEQLDDG